MVISSGHDMLLEKDYAALAQEGLRTARDGARWHLKPRQVNTTGAPFCR